MDLPIACVAAMFLLIYAPRLVVMRAQRQEPGGYDNSHPRDQQARLVGEGKRAQAAHQNSFEAFAPFAAAVLCCEVRHASDRWTTIFALVFLVARLIYPVLYIKDLATARSLSWVVGYGATIALFVLALLG